MKYLLLAAIVCLLVGSAQGLTFYQYNYNTINTHQPYYNLGYIYSGNMIMINLTMLGGTGTTLDQLTVSVDNFAGTTNVATLSAACTTATTCSLEYNITVSDTYVVRITRANYPASNAGASPLEFKFFYLDITRYL